MMTTNATLSPVVGAPNYLTLNVIGSGQFGDVYKAKKVDTDEFVAFKSIELQLFDNVERLHEMAENETQILSKIKNPNVVKFVEMIKTSTHIYTVYELCTGGTLEEILDKKRYLPEKEALQIFRQLLNGFRPLVSMNIMHRDIKPSNIIFHQNIPKIGDFGFSKPLSTSQEVTQTMIGSPIYMAPEILKGQTYSIKADIYSMGVMLYEILYGRAPFEDVNIPGLLNKITKGDIRFPTYNKISPSTEFFIKRMLEPIEEQRITWNELFETFRLTSIDENDLASLQEEFSPILGSEDVGEKGKKGILTTFNMDSTKIDTKEIELILTYFTKECKQTRDKMLYLWRTFSQGYEHIINDDSHIINYLTLRKIIKYSKEVEKLIQNKEGEMTKKEYDALKSQFDYTRLTFILNNEITKFNEALSTYKTYIMTIVDPTKPKRLDNDPAFIAKEFDDRRFEKRVFTYASTIRDAISAGNIEGYGASGNLPLYLNLLLDSIMIDEMYYHFFEINIPFNEQLYLQNLFDMDEEELLELIDEKISYFKDGEMIGK